MAVDPELSKIAGYIFIPLMTALVSINVAKWHFEKDTKKQYLSAKDKVANELIIAISDMLIAMWNLAHTHNSIKSGKLNSADKIAIDTINNLIMEVNKHIINSYPLLGRAGLYFGTNIFEKISQFQSELANMITDNNFEVFNNMDSWNNYRREKILPVIQEMHEELKGTVLDGVRSFRLHL